MTVTVEGPKPRTHEGKFIWTTTVVCTFYHESICIHVNNARTVMSFSTDPPSVTEKGTKPDLAYTKPGFCYAF